MWKRKRHLYIYIADRPEGPFENPVLVYTVEDKFDDQYAQTFGARAHPHLINKKEELLVSYNVNSICNASCESYDADQFRPKFIRVPYSKFARCNF